MLVHWGPAGRRHYWVYGAVATDLGYAISVADTTAGDVREYRIAPGRPTAPITSAETLPDSCRP
ncbi:MAG: hypothetical protein OXH70_09495 [Acidobacteria bacterium]|nr:hypothetical protein [Acidobacteriota bacterium]